MTCADEIASFVLDSPCVRSQRFQKMKFLRTVGLVALGVLLLIIALLDRGKMLMQPASREIERDSTYSVQEERDSSEALRAKNSGRTLNPRQELIEERHGFRLPESAKYVQSSGDIDSGGEDRGLVTIFELTSSDLAVFLEQLTVEEKLLPRKVRGSPVKNGWNVWPTNTKTFVPGNEEYGHLRQNWVGEAEPKYMLSCKSPIGDFLHVEVWGLNNGNSLLKVYTDWN